MLSRYIIGVVLVWAIILTLVKLFGSSDRFRTMAIFCAGFFIGMLAIRIAVRFYKK